MLSKVKLALLITENDFDSELNNLIAAAVKDLGLAGVEGDDVTITTDDELVVQAIITYCGYQFEMMHGALDRAKAYKQSYDEQKAQLGMATGYTVWSSDDE
jgi:hypothetical protein